MFVRDVRLLILEHSRWSMVEKYQALTAGLTLEELMEFSRCFRAELLAEGLVQGNVSSSVSAANHNQLICHRSAILPPLYLSGSLHYAVLCSLRRSQNSSCSM